MPYRSIEELPHQVKVLPVEAQRLFLRVFNEALEQYDGDEEKAFAVAWSVVKGQWQKIDDQWVKRAADVSSKREQLVEYIHRRGFRRAEDLVAALVDLLGEGIFSLMPASKDASDSGSGVELRFWAAVHSIESGDEKRLATFYLMNTSLNRNRWRVTDKALEDALSTLLWKPLGCIPSYRVNHVHEPLQVGKWIRVEKPDGYALATTEIGNDVAWEKVSGGEWGPVSVVIKAKKVACSVCGMDITGAPDEHILSGEGHEVVESFVFDRVDFVNEPAYPQAGLITIGHLAGADTSEGGVLYTSQSTMDGAQGPQGSDPKPEEKKEKKKMEAQLAELQRELETLKAENTELKEKVRYIEAELREAHTKSIPRPKAKYSASDKSAFEAAVEETRERLFGHQKRGET